MRALVVHAHPSRDGFNHACYLAACRGLAHGGHEVRTIDLYAEGFSPVMTPDERAAYETAHPILDPIVAAHADDVRWAEALVFVYPTWWSGLPAILKGWLERVMVTGVAFRLDHRVRVRPALRNVRRLVTVTTHGSGRFDQFLLADSGRRTINRTLRLVCRRTCRTRWLCLYGIEATTLAERQAFLARVERELAAP